MLKPVVRCILVVFFVLAGMNHFRVPAIYLAMMPPWLPWPAGLSTIAGIAEILGGIGIFLPQTRRVAGWGLVVLLVAVFPANVHVALMGHMEGFSFSAAVLWLRLPFQAVLIAGVSWSAIAREPSLVI